MAKSRLIACDVCCMSKQAVSFDQGRTECKHCRAARRIYLVPRKQEHVTKGDMIKFLKEIGLKNHEEF